MAKLSYVPAPKDDKEAALAFIEAYKKQNPKKYEMKKAALFAQFGLSLEEEPVEVKDEELEGLKKVVRAKKDAK